jgi:Fe-S-cluster containining protein
MDDAVPAMEGLRESILKDYPRLGPEDTFQFSCHPGVSCFNECCSDVNIVLTPYDVLRLKTRLGISSEEFLEKYCLAATGPNQRLPIVMLRMSDDEGKPCQLVDPEKGCTVYEDRPWACRAYPVGIASPASGSSEMEKFYFLHKEEVCQGFEEPKEWTVGDWLKDQGAEPYDELGELFKEISLHEHFLQGGTLEPQKLEMLHMVCYNVDKFRRFVFESTFLERFVIDQETVEKIRKDDVELLKFGFQWLKYTLFGEGEWEIAESARKAVWDERRPKEASEES